MKAFTDYPFEELGDEAYKKAPIREIKVLSYDGDKYCKILVNGKPSEVKLGYIYKVFGRYGEVPGFSDKEMIALLYSSEQKTA